MAERTKKVRPQSEADKLFAPPSEDEKKQVEAELQAELFAPPTKEEIDEITGSYTAAVGSLLDSIMLGNVAPLAGAANVMIPFNPPEADGIKERYLKGRDETAAAIEKARQDFPQAAGAGHTLGTVAAMAAGFGGGKVVGKGADIITKKVLQLLRKDPGLVEKLPGFLVRGAAEGAAGGAVASGLQAPPIVEGQVDLVGDLEARLSNAGTGAVLGLPLGLAGGAIARAIDIPVQGARREAELVSETMQAALPEDEIIKQQARLGVDSATREKAVARAGRELGIEPTRGMMSADPVIRNLESSLAQSPSTVGQLVSGKVREVRGELSKVAAGMLRGRATDPDVQYDVGSRIKEKLVQNIRNRYEPIRQGYERLAGDFGAIELDKASKKRVIDNWKWRIEQSGLFREGSSRKAVAMSFLQDIDRLQNAQQLRNYISGIQSEIRAMAKNGEYEPVLGDVLGAAERLLDRTVVKRAIEATGGARGGKVARDAAVQLFNEKRALDREYRRLKEILGSVRGQIKKSGPDTVGTVLDAIDDMPSERLASVMFNPKNIDGLKFMQTELPDVFEELKAFKLREIADKSMAELQGEAGFSFVDPKKFLKQVDDLPPTVREMLFGSKNTRKVDPLRTLTLAIPERVGPSGTPQGLDYQEIGNVGGWISQNLRDIGRFGMMQRGVPGPKGMLFDIERFPRRAQGLSTIGAAGAGMTAGSIQQSQPSFIPSPKIEGFSADQVMPIDPAILPQYLDSIQKDPTLSILEKARLTNLANKHGLAPVGRQ